MGKSPRCSCDSCNVWGECMIVELFKDILQVFFTIIIAPLLGGLLTGIGRIISARLQNRVGPPLLQPFYDVIKLLGKEAITVNQLQIVFVLANLFFMITSLILFVMGEDLLIILVLMAFSRIALIIGAVSIESPYSKLGAYREIWQMAAYEPVLVLMVVGIYLASGSFLVKAVFENTSPLLVFRLPLIFAVYLYVLAILLRKSPFDFSFSKKGRQELINGLTTEFSGPQLAFIEITCWYELVLLLGFITMFFSRPLWMGITIAVLAFLLEIVIDNVCARMTWNWMLKFTWLIGIGAALTNITWLYLR